MAVVDGKLDIVISRDVLLANIDRSGSSRTEFSVEELADSIHTAFCEVRGFRGLQGEIHRRQHIEIAKSIIDAKGASA